MLPEILILGRHGDYRTDRTIDLGLSDKGLYEIAQLADRIRLVVAKYRPEDVAFFAAPARRAQQSGKLIADALGLSIENMDYLASGGTDEPLVRVSRRSEPRHGADVDDPP